MKRLFIIGCVVPLCQAQISDNSFLIEEAYNQERGVVQHIVKLNNYFAYESEFSGDNLDLSFAQEWPLGGQKWQGAYAVSTDREFEQSWLDLQLRYQLYSKDGVAAAPYIAFSAAAHKNTSLEEQRFRVGLPVSMDLSGHTVLHLNGSFESYGYTKEGIIGFHEPVSWVSFIAYVPAFGASLVQHLSPTYDLMVEFAY